MLLKRIVPLRGAKEKPIRRGRRMGFAGSRTEGGSVFPLGFGDALDLLAEQSHVERLLEHVVEPVLSQLFGGGFVLAGEADDQRAGVGLVRTQTGDDLDRFGAAE